MKKSRHTEEHVAYTLRLAEGGTRFDRAPHDERRALISTTGSRALSMDPASRRSYSSVPE